MVAGDARYFAGDTSVAPTIRIELRIDKESTRAVVSAVVGGGLDDDVDEFEFLLVAVLVVLGVIDLDQRHLRPRLSRTYLVCHSPDCCTLRK